MNFIEQRILHHIDLIDFKNANDSNSQNFFKAFVKDFASSFNAKKRNIHNFIHEMQKNILIIVDDDDKIIKF